METTEIVDSFVDRRISLSACVSALDAVLATVIPDLEPEDLNSLRAAMEANHERVTQELDRRETGWAREIARPRRFRGRPLPDGLSRGKKVVG